MNKKMLSQSVFRLTRQLPIGRGIIKNLPLKNYLVRTIAIPAPDLDQSNKNKSKLVHNVTPTPLSGGEIIFSTLINLIAYPFHLIGAGLVTVPAQHVGVGTYFGKYTGKHFQEGMNWVMNPIGFKCFEVFVGQSSMKLENSKIIDKVGNPVVVSGIINYNVTEPEKYVLGLDHPKKYIFNQSDAVLKSVVSKYSYDDLRSENETIQEELTDQAQEVLDVAGVNVSSFTLTDMNYAKEIAHAMLIKQQAQSYTEAKKHIAEASTEIINELMKEYQGLLSKEDQADLIKKLLVVITSGSSVQPTLPLEQ